MNNIIQWNVNGLMTRIKNGEIQRLINQFLPAAICLQHVNMETPQLKNYRTAAQYKNNDNEYRTIILVHDKIAFDVITTPINSHQVTATKLYMNNKDIFYIYNLYNQPSQNYNLQYIKKIFNQHQRDLIIVGDLNSRNPIWDEKCTNPNKADKAIEKIVN